MVIKGGMLISSLVGVDKRSTKDLDTTVRGFPLTHENAERAFKEIAAVEVDDDFAFEFVRTEHIRETDDYPGLRVHVGDMTLGEACGMAGLRTTRGWQRACGLAASAGDKTNSRTLNVQVKTMHSY